MKCSCGRMDTSPGVDLCQACEEDYYRERERERLDWDAIHNAEMEERMKRAYEDEEF